MRLDKIDLPPGVDVQEWLRETGWEHLASRGTLETWAKPSLKDRSWFLAIVSGRNVSIVNHERGFAQ